MRLPFQFFIREDLGMIRRGRSLLQAEEARIAAVTKYRSLSRPKKVDPKTGPVDQDCEPRRQDYR